MSDGAGLLRLSVSEGVFRTDGLTGVLDDKQMMLVGQRHNCFHIRTLTEQMHRYNCLRLGRDGTAYGLYIHVHRIPVYVHHHRRQTQQSHDFCGSDERKGRSNDLISGFQSQAHQGNLQGVRTVTYIDHMLGTGVGLQMLLKSRNFGSLDESRRLNDLPYAGIDILLDTLILRLQVHHLNFLHYCSKINSTTPGYAQALVI